MLKHWRGRRGLSQLDLALAADVSSRHVSFLETGRSSPSAPMVLRLASALEVPLRHVNAMLEAAGHPPAYAEPDVHRGIPESIAVPLRLMKDHHEPFPLVVIDRAYRVLDLNRGALALFSSVLGPAELGGQDINLLRLTFDPNGAQPAVVNFDEVGRALLWRVQREVLQERDGPLQAVLDEVLGLPTVAEDWRNVDLSEPAAPALVIHLRVRDRSLRFVTMITAFQAPQSVLLDELRIETWFPSDESTAEACRELARAR